MLSRDALRAKWPRCPNALIDGVIGNLAALEKHAITTPLRLAHFFAQISHESDGGTITEESLNYSHAARICQVWPTRFPTPQSAEPYVHNPQALADRVYNGRMGNRIATSDGFAFRGRGLLQITGRESYRKIGKLCGLDLENHPELAFDPAHTLEVAATEFAHLNCLPPCDADDVRTVTRRVNGGYTGLQERIGWLKRWKPIFGADAVA